MNRQSLATFGFLMFVVAGAAFAEPASARWNFDKDQTGYVPRGFEAYSGQWKVKADPTAPSQPNVLAQEATHETWPGIVVKESNYGDLWAEVKFKTISGQEDQAAGIIFRYQDKGNFYLLRANADEDNVELFQFVHGIRMSIKGQNIKVPHGAWQALGVEVVGSSITCFFNGQELFTVKHDRYQNGKVGLWTKADSVTYFDNFLVQSHGQP
jgi:hypothetical protein